MILEKLKSKEYYMSKLTTFMRNSYGIEQQFEIFWKLLLDVDSTIDDVFTALSMNEVDEITDMLDKLAELVGTKRQLDVSYNIASVLTHFTLSLTNEELLRAIRTRILQNNYTGTYEDFVKNYLSMGLEVLAFDNTNSAEVDLILNDTEAISDNDKHMFLSGQYTVRSLGVIYSYSVQALALLALWDSITSVYDTAQWGD